MGNGRLASVTILAILSAPVGCGDSSSYKDASLDRAPDTTDTLRDLPVATEGGSERAPDRASLEVPDSSDEPLETLPDRLNGGPEVTSIDLAPDSTDTSRDMPLPTDAGSSAGTDGATCSTGSYHDDGCGDCAALTVMSPYPLASSPAAFMQGATLDWKNATSANELLKMRDVYNVNTVNLYGFEWISDSDKALLFGELSRLCMKVVVRIEAYDTTTFSFQASDLDWIVDRYSHPIDSTHSSLLEFVSNPARRGSVAYFALNMPTDDVQIGPRLGGVNSPTWKQFQPIYAKAFVQRMRSLLASYGFGNARLFLGVFYGWDGALDVPSYRSAGADGYFFNNYSYPDPGGPVQGDSASDDQLINQPRLNSYMDRFQGQYGGSPQVIEYGFHTVEFNYGIPPNQTAGLVQTMAAKRRALPATTLYYRNTFPDIVGTMYFGYNILKTEGTPPALLDWTLVYP